MVRAEFRREYPGPWASAVVHGASGEPIADGVWLRQYFLDKDGRPVRDSDGNFIHVLQKDGKPVIGDDGYPVYVRVEMLPEHRDCHGQRILELHGDEA